MTRKTTTDVRGVAKCSERLTLRFDYTLQYTRLIIFAERR